MKTYIFTRKASVHCVSHKGDSYDDFTDEDISSMDFIEDGILPIDTRMSRFIINGKEYSVHKDFIDLDKEIRVLVVQN